MSEVSDDTLKRLFAQAPSVGADEGFVVSFAIEAAMRRRTRRMRRITLMALLCVFAIGVAVLLAPLALTTIVSNLGNSLLDLPDQLRITAERASGVPGVLYVGLGLVTSVFPLIGAAWLSRRV